MDILIKLDKIIERFQTYLSVALFASVISIVFAMVIFRYVLNNSLVWGEEVLRFLAIWLIIVGSSLTVREDRHVAIDVLQSVVSSKKAKMILYTITRITAATFLIILLPGSIELIQKSSNSIANTVPITYFWVYLSFPVGAILMLLSFISVIPRHLKSMNDEEVSHH